MRYGVELRGQQASVSQQFLDSADVVAGFQEAGCEFLAEVEIESHPFMVTSRRSKLLTHSAGNSFNYVKAIKVKGKNALQFR